MLGVPEFLGHPLLAGEQINATAASDLFFRWTPGQEWFFMRVQHPPHGADPDTSPTARFYGYPPVQAPTGVVLGEDSTSRFLTVLNGFPTNLWHRDVAWSLGIPAVDGRTLFTGVGGPGAVRGVAALDAATGAVRWTFMPQGGGPDPQRVVRTVLPKTITVPKGAGITPGVQSPGPGAVGATPTPGAGASAGTGASARGLAAPSIARPRPTFGANRPFAPRRAGDTAAAGPVETRNVQVPVEALQANSLVPNGHWSNSGLVLLNKRVYAEVNRSIVALEQETGKVAWEYPLNERAVVRSLVATPKHLVACVSITPRGRRQPLWEPGAEEGDHMLLGLRLDTGKQEWIHPVEKPGNLALSGGLLFFTDGDLHVYAPAERTYEMGIDSPRPEDYRNDAGLLQNPAGETSDVGKAEEAGQSCSPAPAAAQASPKASGLAEATVVRVRLGEPLEAMVRRGQERRAMGAHRTMLLSLEWLDPTRASVLGGNPNALPEAAKFAALCAALASGCRPDHFDIAPEVNVYLARHPERLEAVRALIRTAAGQVRRASPSTRVVVSLNAEILSGSYGKGSYLPFGQVPGYGPLVTPKESDRAKALALVADVDELGLASWPQAGFHQAEAIPPDYLLALKRAAGDRPVVVTALHARADLGHPKGDRRQAEFLQQIVERCYWLEAPLVACPDAGGMGTESPLAFRGGSKPRPAMEVWNGLLSWKRVPQLQAGRAEPLLVSQ